MMMIGNVCQEVHGVANKAEAAVKKTQQNFIVDSLSQEVLIALVGDRSLIKSCNNGHVQAPMSLISVPYKTKK
jgi:hypothetical protein